MKGLEPEEVNHIFILSKPQFWTASLSLLYGRCHTWLWFNTSNKSSSSPLLSTPHSSTSYTTLLSSKQPVWPSGWHKIITSSNGKHQSYFKIYRNFLRFSKPCSLFFFPQLYYPRFLASCYCHFLSKLSLICKNVSKRYELLDIISFSRFYTLKF